MHIIQSKRNQILKRRRTWRRLGILPIWKSSNIRDVQFLVLVLTNYFILLLFCCYSQCYFSYKMFKFNYFMYCCVLSFICFCQGLKLIGQTIKEQTLNSQWRQMQVSFSTCLLQHFTFTWETIKLHLSQLKLWIMAIRTQAHTIMKANWLNNTEQLPRAYGQAGRCHTYRVIFM